MKNMVIALLLMMATSILFAKEIVPVCKNVGSDSEGWFLGDDRLNYELCSTQSLAYLFTGSDSEGWYAINNSSLELVKVTAIVRSYERPVCKNVGSDSEGWFVGKKRINYNICSQQFVAYLYTGSDSEGWYAIDSSDLQTLEYILIDYWHTM